MKELATMMGLAFIEKGDEGSWLGVGLVLIGICSEHLKVCVDLRAKIIVS
jgi:hypothetical protein